MPLGSGLNTPPHRLKGPEEVSGAPEEIWCATPDNHRSTLTTSYGSPNRSPRGDLVGSLESFEEIGSKATGYEVIYTSIEPNRLQITPGVWCTDGKNGIRRVSTKEENAESFSRQKRRPVVQWRGEEEQEPALWP